MTFVVKLPGQAIMDVEAEIIDGKRADIFSVYVSDFPAPSVAEDLEEAVLAAIEADCVRQYQEGGEHEDAAREKWIDDKVDEMREEIEDRRGEERVQGELPFADQIRGAFRATKRAEKEY